MLAAFILGLAPILFIAIAAACVRRALPIGIAVVAGWVIYEIGKDWTVAIWTALIALGLAAYVFDRLAAWAPTRTPLVVLETLAGLSVAGIAAFSVFYSGGVRDSALTIAIGVSVVAAFGVMALFRYNDQEPR